MRSWARRAAIGVVALVVVVVGGTFIYIHFIEGSAPAKLALSAAPTGAGNAPSLPGTWSVTTGSVAGYRVGEVIFGQDNTAVGRTDVISGTITVQGSSVVSGSFTADLTAVHSDQSQRDNQFRTRIMDVAKYPTATFRLTQPITFQAPSGDATTTAPATGDLTLHGVTRPVTFTVTARRNGAHLEVLGSVPVTFAEWSIPSPSLAGVVTTQDHGVMEFLLVLAKGASAPAALASGTTSTTGPHNARSDAYRACLAAHGVTLPSPGQGGAPPAGAGGPPPGSGGAGGGGGPGAASPSPAAQAAQAACASLRPTGGFTQPTISPTTVPPLGL